MAERYTLVAHMANAMDTLETRMTGRTVTPKLPRPSSKRA